MKRFLDLMSPEEASQFYLKKFDGVELSSEIVPVTEALGRVASEDVFSDQDLPQFNRSSVDGYAVIAKDTYAASDALPVYLSVIGEVKMGQTSTDILKPGKCVLIHTGGMIPENANAVVMLEDTQMTSTEEIELYRPAAFGDNIIKRAEDLIIGDIVIKKSSLIRSQEIGSLLAIGQLKVNVFKKPLFGILSTGDELVNPGDDTNPGQVRDINSYVLKSLLNKFGAETKLFGIVPDDRAQLEGKLNEAFQQCDGVIITAGSSVSDRDMTAKVIDNLGKPGVLVHGVNIRPGKPTILAIADGKPIIGLPGNPVSAFVITNTFVKQIIRKLYRLSDLKMEAYINAKISINIPSVAGRQDWIPVMLKYNEGQVYAEPIFYKSNLIYSLVKADGFICISEDMTGLHVGSECKVYCI